MRSAPKLENRADLLNFMRANPLPATLEEMEELKTYTVDGIAAIWDMFEEADGSKVSLVERFRTHSNAFERIHTHSYAFIRMTSLACLPRHHLRRCLPVPSRGLGI